MSRSTARATRALLGTATSATLLAAGLVVTAHPASGAPGDDAACPAAYPATALTLGQEVTGATTAGSYRRAGVEHDSQTTPEAFSGIYRGTVEDPAGDLLVFELEGSRITGSDGKVDAGVWAGISGSPLYASDGRLVGAVSYSFSSTTASVFAGVTPAAELYDLLEPAAPAAAPARIVPDRSEQRALASAGVPAATASSGAVRLTPDTQIAGLGSGLDPQMLRAIARKAGRAMPRVAGGGSSQSEEIAIVPGANVAAAQSYGSVAIYSVGTASAVCDGVVIGYGHPDAWRSSPRTIHGASTVIIQDDGAYSFKLANLGAPMGTLLQDRLSGITGRLGTLPDSAAVSIATGGPKPHATTSEVVDPEAMAYVVASQAYRDANLTLDQASGGEATVAWTVDYRRADGTPGTYRRSQRYASAQAIAEEVPSDVAGDIDAILTNPFERVTITGVAVQQDVSPTYRAYEMGAVEVRSHGIWERVRNRQRVVVRPGKILKVRVHLRSAAGSTTTAPQSRIFQLATPRHAIGRGAITIEGHGASFWDDLAEWEGEDGEEEGPQGPEARSFDELLSQLASTPRQDRVDLTFLAVTPRRFVERTTAWGVGTVVTGSHALRLVFRGTARR